MIIFVMALKLVTWRMDTPAKNWKTNPLCCISPSSQMYLLAFLEQKKIIGGMTDVIEMGN